MSEQKKPRVFRYVTHIATTTETFGELNPRLDLVEYSAFQALKAENDELVDALKEIAKDFGTDYCDGNTMIAHEALAKRKK